MKKDDLTLVIMAAGMGSRFVGLKQIEPIGPNGEFLIDYSIYDAIKAGFTKVVFIIKKENEEIFKSTIGSRVEGHIPVSYVFQETTNIPVPKDLSKRVKPLGTGHAIYCCKDEVTTPFAIINADDFYGRDAYIKMAEYLKSDNNEEGTNTTSDKPVNPPIITKIRVETYGVDYGIPETEEPFDYYTWMMKNYYGGSY